ncbi:MAG: xanthine dehydrogenase family protein subunit M [Pseudomonadota bacterium]
MYSFAYHKPSSLDEATSLFEGADDARYIAGGHTLLPSMKLRLAGPSDLIDLGGLGDLKGITVDGQGVRVGAGTSHNDVATSADVRAAIPALAELAGGIGDFQVRNRGTIGGSLANNDPAADYPAAVLGLAATVHTNKRDIAADEFFAGMFETALDDGELITAVSFPKPRRASYAKFPNPASRYAIVGVMVAETVDGIRVAVTGAGPCVFRVAEMEQALAASFSDQVLASIHVPDDDMNSDIHAGADYRAHLVTVMAQRAVAAAS